MRPTLTEDTWLNCPAWTLEDPVVRVRVIPSLGNKIASLVHKPTGRELLFQPVNGRYEEPEFAGSFLDYDTSGIDEMLPTIDRCAYPDGSFQGVELPDHGEVWSLPWEARALGNTLEAEVQLRRLPLKFRRSISLDGKGGIRLDYRVDNLGQEGLRYLWAFHPLQVKEEGMKLLLPKGEREVFTVHNLGPRGTVHKLDAAGCSGSLPFDIRELDAYRPGECYKFYLGPLNSGLSGLHYRKSKLAVLVESDPEENPYLGVWVNLGDPGVKGDVNLALEPTNGFFDALDEAHRRGTAPLVPPGGFHTWTLKLRVLGEADAELGRFY